jgi:2-furoate---CoA ligase
MNLSLMFQFAKDRTPDKLAIVDGDIRLTYSAWGSRVEGFARHLADLGIVKGDTVAIFMENSETYATAFFSLQLLGAVPVPFNSRSKKERVLYHLKDSEAKMIIFSDFTAASVEEALPEIPDPMQYINVGLIEHAQFLSFERIMSTSPEYQGAFPELNGNDLSCILYTSGTTGEPKGIPLSHENSISRIVGLALNCGYLHQNDDKMIGLMPLFHTVGLHAVLLSSVMFNHTYYPIKQFDPLKTLELIEKEKITLVFGTPTHFQMILKMDGFNRYDLSSIRHVLYGGAPMSPSLVRECVEKLCNDLTLVYGNTEAYNPLYMRHTQHYPGMSVGGVFHNLRLVKFGGSEEDRISPEEEGEMIVDMRSPESFTHYLKKPHQTEKKVKNGWYYSGDVFRLTTEGYIQYSGRVDDMIISGGENIHPSEVEDHILSHPDVKDAAIVGLPEEKWGQLVKAYIVRKDNSLDVDRIDQYLRNSSLENFKRPRAYEFIDAIPRNPSGKILRMHLVAMSIQEEKGVAE